MSVICNFVVFYFNFGLINDIKICIKFLERKVKNIKEENLLQ